MMEETGALVSGETTDLGRRQLPNCTVPLTCEGTTPALVMAYGFASTGSWPFCSAYLMCQWVITHEAAFGLHS